MRFRKILRNMTYILPDKMLLHLEYFRHFHRPLNLKDPKTFNEKLQWLKLYDRNPEYTQMVDKQEAKRYITEAVGAQYIIPTLGVWDQVEDIDFDSLPDQFVLKTVHDSGGVVICKDKKNFDTEGAKRFLKEHQKENYYLFLREWPYKNVKPRIIAEQYMVDESGTQLKDYKIFCFNGEPYCVQVDFDRFESHKKNMYSLDWELLDFSFNYPSHPEIQIPRPDALEEMLQVARVLSAGKPYLRVDFYTVDRKPYIGELTLFPASGYGKFNPDHYDRVFGDMIQLPKKTITKE